jgi:hypothetical protein
MEPIQLQNLRDFSEKEKTEFSEDVSINEGMKAFCPGVKEH